jgi:5-methyltetrahydrofolate--homocysteine methyltransferase
MDHLLNQLYTAILEGERGEARKKTNEAIQAHYEPGLILDTMIQAMQQVGKLYEQGDYYVPEMLIAARAMQESMDILRPHLQGAAIQPVGVAMIGTVKGDVHDIGKNLVAMMLEGLGFKVIDLGMDVSIKYFVEAVDKYQPDIVAMSALLTTTMPYMKQVIEALKEAGKRDYIKIIIGGAPINEAYARKIGADGYAPDASSAARLALELLKGG